jgi:hypothetical protein
MSAAPEENIFLSTCELDAGRAFGRARMVMLPLRVARQEKSK